MRRSIAYTEPKFALAGQRNHWKFVYTAAAHLPKGAKLKFDMLSKGKAYEWELPSVADKPKGNILSLELPNQEIAFPKALFTEEDPCATYEFTLPVEVKAEETLIFHLGSHPEKIDKAHGNRAQCYLQRKRPFRLSLDPKGKGDYKEIETFSIDIRGNKLANVRPLIPSMVSRNQRFDITLRFEDEYGNLTNNAPENTLIELSYAQLRDNINWKLFVPETGFIILPNLYFNEVGNYRLQLKNLSTKQTFFSHPIRCVDQSSRSIYWGSFHDTLGRFNPMKEIESHLRYARDEKAWQFFGLSPFETDSSTSENWKIAQQQITEFNEEDRFSAFLGSQWVGQSPEEGMRQLIYLKDAKPLIRKKDTKSSTLKKIHRSHSPKELLSIPTMTMAKGMHTNFENHFAELEPVVEIYNAWGSSECAAKEGNLYPHKSKKGLSEAKEGSIRDALNNNHRFGFIAGGRDHRGPCALLNKDQVEYTPGITAIIAQSHSRDGLIQALHKRSSFATTGARMLIDLEIAQMPVGSMLSTKTKPGLAYNRHIQGYAVGTAPLKEVILIRNGKVYKSFELEGDTFEFTLDDQMPYKECTLPTTEGTPFMYYYLRATQADNHTAWASPIWIDFPVSETLKKTKKKT